MHLRPLLSALVAAAALTGPAAAETKPTASVVKLRNVSAADAAVAVTTFADGKKLPVTAVAEPVSNCLVVAGTPEAVKAATDLLAGLDKPAPAAHVQMLMAVVPAGFVAATGLGSDQESEWVLTPREVRMLTAAICTAKGRGEVDVVSRPQVVVADNQTGLIQVGGEAADGRFPAAVQSGLTVRVTPRLAPDGSAVTLRTECQLAQAGAHGRTDLQTLQATFKLSDGGTVVIRGPVRKAGGVARETLIVLTVDRVTQPAK